MEIRLKSQLLTPGIVCKRKEKDESALKKK